MSITMICLGVALLTLGFVGCVVPVLPGPILAYGGLLALIPTERCPSAAVLAAAGIGVALVTVADYIVPALGAKKFNGSRWGTFGCFVGTIVGIFFVPIGLLLGPFLGAVAGELVAGRQVAAAVRGGFGALLGFLSGVFLKIGCCAVLAFVFARCVI